VISAWAAVVTGVLALAEPPRKRPPAHGGAYNVALGKLVYAAPLTFWAPFERGEPQHGLQRLTDGVLAGRAGLVTRQAILFAPYTADLPEVVLPEAERQRMAGGGGFLEVDLGGVYRVEALALEADAAGDYKLEVSPNGRFWHSLWTAPAAIGHHGWVVRQSGPLVHPVDARYVRLSASVGDPIEAMPGSARRLLFAASELQVFTSQARPRDLP
jgi:hypothetical protein